MSQREQSRLEVEMLTQLGPRPFGEGSEPPPEKFSALLRAAIADARSLDRNRYGANHTLYHAPRELYPQCFVCLGGAMLAGTLGLPVESHVQLTDLPWRWACALSALNLARQGKYNEAVEMHMDSEASFDGYIPTPAFPQFRGWFQFDRHLESQERAVTMLEAVGF